MAAEGYYIISKEVEKVRNYSLKLFAHSLSHISTQVFITNHVDKMVEL